jgi:putative SOS response-associated peptidase YedK
MCHDLSFSANTVEFITDLLPDVIFTGQRSIDFSTTEHVLSMSHRKCLVVYNEDGQLKCSEFEWGLIAPFMYTPELVKQYRIQMANARVEKIFDKRSVWYKLREKNRCLVAVAGIMEHREIKGWKNKVPYYINLACSTHILLPGFYNYSPNPDPETGEVKGTFSVITQPANDIMKKIHNHGPNKHRMPLFMQPVQALKWVTNDLTDEQIKEFTSHEIPSEELEVRPVFTVRTTKSRPDGKSKTESYEWPNLPPLGTDEVVKQNDLFA